jgi:NAD(P)H-flavin reductase
MDGTDPWMPEPMEVTRVVREAPGVFTLTLGPTRGFAFEPGQFNMLYLFGTGEVPISLCGDPARPQELVHTIRAVGSVTRPMEKIRRGAVLGVRGPYGSAWPLEIARGKDLVLVAGGIGLAPLRPVLYDVLRRRADYGRVALLYGARTPADLLYRKEIETWRGRLDLDVHVTVDQAGPDWRGHVGAVTALMPLVRVDAVDSVALVCGPEVMMRFTARELERLGIDADRTYVSLERNMKCALGFCGHCQLGPTFVCKDGPVYRLDTVARLFHLPEV